MQADLRCSTCYIQLYSCSTLALDLASSSGRSICSSAYYLVLARPGSSHPAATQPAAGRTADGRPGGRPTDHPEPLRAPRPPPSPPRHTDAVWVELCCCNYVCHAPCIALVRLVAGKLCGDYGEGEPAREAVQLGRGAERHS